MIDFHSHILPGIDDGSTSVEESLEMLQAEAEQGITHVVMTPHFYAHHNRPDSFIEKRQSSKERLDDAVSHTQLPKYTIGAEVFYYRGMSASELLPQLAIHGNCIMVEMPQPPWPESAYDDLLQIRRKWGLTPVIAHIDRYISPMHTHRIPQKLRELPVLVQANASFFLNRSTRQMALRMLKEGKIHLLGSDCHNMSSRKPNLGEAVQLIERRLGSEAVERLEENAKALLGI